MISPVVRGKVPASTLEKIGRQHYLSGNGATKSPSLAASSLNWTRKIASLVPHRELGIITSTPPITSRIAAIERADFAGRVPGLL
jgi:hypothetical protein